MCDPAVPATVGQRDGPREVLRDLLHKKRVMVAAHIAEAILEKATLSQGAKREQLTEDEDVLDIRLGKVCSNRSIR